MKHRTNWILTALVCLALAPSASAAPEQGDAGDLPASAQDLTAEAVTAITGTLADGDDIDLYRVCLGGGRTFSASTVGGTEVDTQLFLFTGAGLGVYANNDEGFTSQSLLPAGAPFSPETGGEYVVGISPYDRDPQSAEGPIFPNRAYTVGATDRGAGAPVEIWAGRPRGFGSYAITLTGTRACESTAPTVDIASPVNGDTVALGATVLADYSCADQGGSGLVSCVGTVADGAPLDTSTLGTKTLTVTARDGAGNESVASVSIEVVDETSPAIAIAIPVAGAVYNVGDLVTADYACADEPNGSGVATCTGDVADGAPLDTAAPGPKTFTVNASDVAGNPATSTVSYEVVEKPDPPLFDFSGFFWPVEDFPEVNRWMAGWPVALRFSLGGPEGLDILAPGYPQVAEVECGEGETPAGGEPARSPWWRKGLRYKPRRDRYVFWWRTERHWAGECRQFVMKLSDGSVHRAEFHFVKRWRELWLDDD